MCTGELTCGLGKYLSKVSSSSCVDDGHINLLLKAADSPWLTAEHLLHESCELEFTEVSTF